MNDIKPILIDIFNIRQERQKYNNTIAINKIQQCNICKDINIEEYKRILLELSTINITENDLLNECKKSIILTYILAGRIAINASRQGIKDEIIQLDTLNITSSKLGINIEKLSPNLYRPTKYGEILINSEIKKRNINLSDCLKSFDAKITGKITGWIFAKIVIGSGGHQDNVFEEAYNLCEWINNFSNKTDIYIILIDTDLIIKYNNLKEKYKNIHNLIIGNHIYIQQYLIDNYSVCNK
jgi:hypothetical protein